MTFICRVLLYGAFLLLPWGCNARATREDPKVEVVQNGHEAILRQIADSVPKGPDGQRLSGLQLLKKTYATLPGGRTSSELDEIADLIAEHKQMASEKARKNEKKIHKVAEAAQEVDWKPPPPDFPLSEGAINAAYGLDDILVEGDILMSPKQIKHYYGLGKGGGRVKRQAMKGEWTIWKNGVVDYGFNDSFPEKGRAAVRAAMAFWEANTCIRFKYHADMENVPRWPVIRFFEGNGCWSGSLGRQDAGQYQDLSLASHCQQVRTTTHEIGHALGLIHEQSRYDRDNYITIDTTNIQASPTCLWAKDTSKPVMYAINKNYQMSIGWSELPTYGDFFILNKHYRCENRCLKDKVCKNDGTRDPNCEDSCLCPSGFGGNDCSERQAPSPGTKCGEVLKASDSWKSLAIEKTVGNGQAGEANLTAPSHCTWHVTAPAGRNIDYRVKYIGYDKNEKALCEYACRHGGLSIKGLESNWITEGMRFCCPAQYNIEMKTASNLLVVQPWNGRKYTDFEIEYRLDPATTAVNSTTASTTTSSTTTTSTTVSTTSSTASTSTASTNATTASTPTTPSTTTESTTRSSTTASSNATTASTPSTTTESPTTVEPVVERFFGKYILVSTPMSFGDAEAYCETKNAQLLVLHSKGTENTLQRVFNQLWPEETNIFWIGLKKAAGKESAFTWVDGSAVDYEKWPKRKPKPTAKEQCVAYWDPSWSAINCAFEFSSVCKKF
uniref:Metalloendopeptidase n=1 Tax=Steinernema glaseri TaxID=37863 RepID=A0A1I7Y0M8_9BILA